MYIQFLTDWLRLKSKGGSILTQCVKNGWKNIAIYGAGSIGIPLFEDILSSGLQVNYIIDGATDVKFPYKAKIIKIDDIPNEDPVDVIIVTPFKEYSKIKQNLENVTTIKTISIYTLMSEFYPDTNLMNISNYLAEKNVDLFLFSHPLAKDVKNPTFFETYIGKYLEPPIVNRLEAILPFYNDLEYNSLDYLEQICNKLREKPQIAPYICEYFDVTTQYLNLFNNTRFVPDAPDDYTSTIYFFGDCIAVGVFAEDKFTAPNFLQKLINNTLLRGRKYKVVAKTIRIWDLGSFYNIIQDLDLDSNDIIIHISNFYNVYEYHAQCPNIHYFDITPIFDRPHEFGEVFLDYSHLNHRGYKVIADKIYKTIVNFEASLDVPKLYNTNISNIENAPSTEHKYFVSEKIGAYEMELQKYLDFLKAERVEMTGTIGSIVMNCNPFTLGHQYLIEKASQIVDFLYIFIVEEDKSVYPFEDRIDLVKKGTQHLKNIKVLPSGMFIISAITFEAYFSKETLKNATIDPSSDIELFSSKIAPVLNISIRFAGNEPFCPITKQYNNAMKESLPKYGICFQEFAREEKNGLAISASEVRKLISEGNFEKLKELVPETTYSYLMKRLY